MWYHVGRLNGNNTITWGPSYWYDNGYNPKVTIYGTTVVEVHNAGTSESPMWYHVGRLNGNNTITWGPSYRYDNGYNPQVAINGSGAWVVEVHNAGPSESPMWYHVGRLNGNNTITWGPSYEYDNGWNPSLAFICSDQGIVEVHNAGDYAGPMWYHTVSSGDGLYTIRWSGSQYYDQGFNPSVAASWFAVEVHNAQNAAGPMWYRVSNSPCIQ